MPTSVGRKERNGPDCGPVPVIARFECARAEPALVSPPVDTFPGSDIPHIHLTVLSEREELAPVALPRDPLDGDVHLDFSDDLTAPADSAAAPIDEMDVAAPTGESEYVARAGREPEPFHPTRAAGRLLVASAQTGVEQTAR